MKNCPKCDADITETKEDDDPECGIVGLCQALDAKKNPPERIGRVKGNG
jgi:hypothetical protein